MEDWPPRRYGWIAQYTDGDELREVYDAPPLTAWEDVETDRLAVLVLEDVWPSGEGEVLRVDCATGTIHVRGVELAFRVGTIPLTGRDGAYRDVVQYKTAHSDYRPGHGSSGTIIDAYHLGYDKQLPEGTARIVARLNPHTRHVGIEATLDLDQMPGGGFEILADGEPVTTQAAFRKLTRPVGVG